jgi:hypothetical protein
MCQASSTSRARAAGSRTAGAGMVLLLLGSPAAFADEAPNLLTDPFQVALGTFAITSEPTVQLKGEVSNGDRVDFDEALGGGDSQRIRLDSHWRFADRHKAKLIAFEMSRDNRTTFDRDIEWGGDVYPVGAEVDAEFSFTVIELAYEYTFLQRDNYELDASFGLHYTDISSSLKAKVEASGGTLTEDISNSASVAAPLPAIGLRGIWNLSHNFWLDATAQFFALSIDQYDGNLQDYRVLVTWQPKTWLGIGLGYNRFSVDVDVDSGNFNGSLDWTYSGPMVFYSASF